MGIYISLLSVPSHLKPYTEGATTMAANARMRTKDGCNLIPSSKLTTCARILRKGSTNLPKEEPRRKLEFISVRFTVVFVNLRVVKKRYLFCLVCRNHGITRTQFVEKLNMQCLWGCPTVRMRDPLNHIQGNVLGAGWIDHHTGYSYYSLCYVGW